MTAQPKRCLPEVTPIEFNILLSLLIGERHGLGLIQEIADRTNQEIFLSPGTLYNALKRMSRDGWIEQSREAPPAKDGNAERRHYYRLSEPGYEVLVDEAERMERIAQETRTLLERFHTPNHPDAPGPGKPAGGTKRTVRDNNNSTNSRISLADMLPKRKKLVPTSG